MEGLEKRIRALEKTQRALINVICAPHYRHATEFIELLNVYPNISSEMCYGLLCRFFRESPDLVKAILAYPMFDPFKHNMVTLINAAATSHTNSKEVLEILLQDERLDELWDPVLTIPPSNVIPPCATNQVTVLQLYNSGKCQVDKRFLFHAIEQGWEKVAATLLARESFDKSEALQFCIKQCERRRYASSTQLILRLLATFPSTDVSVITSSGFTALAICLRQSDFVGVERILNHPKFVFRNLTEKECELILSGRLVVFYMLGRGYPISKSCKYHYQNWNNEYRAVEKRWPYYYQEMRRRYVVWLICLGSSQARQRFKDLHQTLLENILLATTQKLIII